MKFYQCLILSAAVLGSTFVLSDPLVVESVPAAEKAVPVTVVRVPASNDQAIGEMLTQFQQLQMELASLRGLIEVLSYELNVLRSESKDRYIDLDRRISENRNAAPVIVNPTVTAITPVNPDSGSGAGITALVPTEPLSTDPALILAAYTQAKDLIRQKDYKGSIAAFNRFVIDYPTDELTANAWYWLGEVYLVIPDVQNAIRSFAMVVKNYPNHQKHPDALYRLGVTLLKTDDVATGRQYLEQLIQRYPDSQLSVRAQQALSSQ